MIEMQIKNLSDRLKVLFKKIGNQNAFGDQEIIKIIHSINSRIDLIERTEPCKVCDGKGGEDHNCNYFYCDKQTEECEECDGSGRIKKIQ